MFQQTNYKRFNKYYRTEKFSNATSCYLSPALLYFSRSTEALLVEVTTRDENCKNFTLKFHLDFWSPSHNNNEDNELGEVKIRWNMRNKNDTQEEISRWLK